MNKSPNLINKVVIDGITFDLPRGSKIPFNNDPYTTTNIATSGRSIEKKTKKVQHVTVDLISGESDQSTIGELEQREEEIRLSISLHDGSVYLCTGIVDKSFKRNDNVINVVLTPVEAWRELI
jgi:hypothetical protein